MAKKKKFYAVRQGWQIGIFSKSKAYHKAVDGYSGAEAKGFNDVNSAMEWLNEGDINRIAAMAEDPRQDKKPKAKNKISVQDIKFKIKTWWSNFYFKAKDLFDSYDDGEKSKICDEFKALSATRSPLSYCRIKTEHSLTIYTDGSYYHKDGSSSYGAAIIDTVTGAEFYIGGKAEMAMPTSTLAELHAIIEALKVLDTSIGANVRIRTDCKGLVNKCSKKQLEYLRAKGWPHETDESVKLLETLYYFHSIHNITVKWVRGHDEDYYNNQTDMIAMICRAN